jgi:uncharacterized protein with PIN domain
MSARSGIRDTGPGRSRFLVDRMLGTLTRYLRCMGYDTLSANSFPVGDPKEDTFLLSLALEEGRVLLTRDHELARRGKNRAVLIRSDDVLDQVGQLTALGLVTPQVVTSRCPLCNSLLSPATAEQVASAASYAPADQQGIPFFWCRHCSRLYWEGSHGDDLQQRLSTIPCGEVCNSEQ